MYKQILLGAFKWATIHQHRSRGCKTVAYQSWRSEKIALLVALLLSKKGFQWVRVQIFFGPPTLTSHSFAAPWPTIMNSISFESPKPYMYALNLKQSIVPHLRCVILVQPNPFYVVVMYKLNISTAHHYLCSCF